MVSIVCTIYSLCNHCTQLVSKLRKWVLGNHKNSSWFRDIERQNTNPDYKNGRKLRIRMGELEKRKYSQLCRRAKHCIVAELSTRRYMAVTTLYGQWVAVQYTLLTICLSRQVVSVWARPDAVERSVVRFRDHCFLLLIRQVIFSFQPCLACQAIHESTDNTSNKLIQEKSI